MGGRVVIYFGKTEKEIALEKEAIRRAKTYRQRLRQAVGMINIVFHVHRTNGIISTGSYFTEVTETSTSAAKHYARFWK